MADIDLKIEGLKKHFGGVRAVDGISVHVQGNELIGLIGPNGSGKTTTINTINGLLNPTAGKIIFQGERIENMPSYQRARRGLGRTFQVTRVFQAHEVMAFLTIERLADENAQNLSGGQQKLLELGRVLMLDPDVIFLDEPFAGVHPELSKQIHKYIRKVHQDGKAFIIVSHDMDTIFGLSERVIVMNEGKKIADGDPEAVRTDEAVIDAYLGEASEKAQLEGVSVAEGN